MIKLNFVIDVGVGKLIEDWLIDEGHTVFGMMSIERTMSDNGILDFAVANNCIIITMDKDFGELVFKNGLKHKGVLLLRLDDAAGVEKLSVVKTVVPQYLDSLHNNFCVFQNGKFRIKK
jgi:predicted nuclease of predicted toxin-antitoxin system